MRTTLLLLALLAGPAFAGQVVWKWVDANGVTHYADRPVPGATRMELSTGTPSSSASSSFSTSSPSTTQPAGPAYTTLEIWKPSADETIANTGGQVTVNVRIEPALQPGNSLVLYLDGRLVEGLAADTQSFELNEVTRGTHTVTAIVLSGRGERVQQSEPVVFHVRQESAAAPPTGPALRPPPKPTPRAGNKMATSQPTYAALNPVAPKTKIDPVTNRPVVVKQPAKPSTPKSGK